MKRRWNPVKWYRPLAKLVMNGSRGAVKVRPRAMGVLPPKVNSISNTKVAYRRGTRFVLSLNFYHNRIYCSIIFENFALGIVRVRPAGRAGKSGGFETLYGDGV